MEKNIALLAVINEI